MTWQMLEQAIILWGRGQLVICLFHYLHMSSALYCIFYGALYNRTNWEKGFCIY